MPPVSATSLPGEEDVEGLVTCHRFAATPNAAGVLLHGPWLLPAAAFVKKIPGIQAIGLATSAILVPKAFAPHLQTVLNEIDAWRCREARRIEESLWGPGLLGRIARFNAHVPAAAAVEADLPILLVRAPATPDLRAALLACGFSDGDAGALWFDLSQGSRRAVDEFCRAQAICDALDRSMPSGTEADAVSA
ncbi:hypothetical protein LAZ40_04490 [Cereibacter sphaeroides]|uniref:hypothetical protein n=1 Tax=Cereibacter sphaeroides TaxID=1063 RepID=UPI001F382D32|nr:hypothetical protein [Cereibacter sphaeroides]MCE6958314.1 hypothetical protein [Cereibacter sphaeroides]MCE6971924.1 hypothetical protein [Cereibacter sphaeroides]